MADQQLDKNMHILVVDDQEPSCVLARFCLMELGFKNIHETTDGRKAMEYLAKSYKDGNPVKLLLCDHEMPEVDGFALFRLLRATEQYNDAVFVMVTSHSEPELVAAMASKGVTNFIVKPISSAILGKKLMQFMLRG
jgi:CheY-like chemotaxis protein